MRQGKFSVAILFYNYRNFISTIVGKMFQQSSEKYCIIHNFGV